MREAANVRLMHLRSSFRLEDRPSGKTFIATSAKDDFADELIARLPAFGTLPAIRQQALGNGEYSKIIVAAIGVCAEQAKTIKEFDYLSGMYAHAYPSQIRADLMHYAWAGGNTRARLEIDNGTSKRKDGLTLTDYRRDIALAV